MKKIIATLFLVLFVFSGIAVADETLKFKWDYTGPAVDGFRLFAKLQTETDYGTPIWEGKELTAEYTFTNGAYSFMVRAFIGKLESANSNEVWYTVEEQSPPIIVPSRPKSLTLIFGE